MKLALPLLILLCLLLSSCASTHQAALPPNTYSYQLKPLPQSTSDYLTQASQNVGSQQTDAQLLAITTMLEQNDLNAAQQELAQINQQNLTQQQNNYQTTLRAYLTLLKGDTYQALQQLNRVTNTSGFSLRQRIIYFKVLYQTNLRNNRLVNAVIAQINLYNLLTNNHEAQLNSIWRNLQQLSQQQLVTVINSNSSPLIKAWFQLALIAEQQANNPTKLVSEIQAWQQQHPNHPANQLLPNPQQLQTAAQFKAPAQIALLLPLSGRFSAVGNAVRNGFMTAYYQLDQQLAVKPSLRFYDTNKQPITTLYQQAVENGATFVIGPLSKTNVEQLVNNVSISVPTLVLNYTDNPPNSSQLIEFGLSPLQSAQQSAQLAWRHGVSKVLTITPNSAWGDSALASFIATWKAQGGQIVSSLKFDNHNLANQIADLLHIDRSVLRKNQVEKLIGQRVKFIPRRRYDANGIFLLAAPEQARDIHPLLKFYFAGSLPIYATPEVYHGYKQAERNRDLNGIHFVDMPFLLSKNPYIQKLRQQIESAWPRSYQNNNRFFAVGIDAFSLSLLYPRLTVLPNFGVNGFSGRLYLEGQRIYRQLLPAVIYKDYAKTTA